MKKQQRQVPEYTFVKELPLREILEEVRRMNSGGDKRAYLRYRSHFFTFQHRPLLAGREVDLSRVAVQTAHQFGGRVVRVAFHPYTMEVDYLCPANLGYEKANRWLAREMSRHFKQHYKGIGSAENNGFLWSKKYITYSMESPLLERRREFITL